MSLPAQKSKNDYNKYLNSYLATLNQSIQNNNLVYNAVSANLAGDMMAIPQMPQDNRSVEDKMRDIENLKVQLQSQLLSLTDGKTANEIVQSLEDQEIQQAVQSFPSLYQTLKPLWSMGVPSVIFIQALRNLALKQDLTAGIEMNMQQGNANTLQLSPQQLQGLIDAGDLDNLMSVAQSAGVRGGLLDQISYVKQLFFDKGDLPNRIERARQIEAASGIDQSIPISAQKYLIPKAEFGLLLQEIVDARMNGDEREKNRAIKNIMDYLTPPDEVVADMEDFKEQEGQAGVEETKGELTPEQQAEIDEQTRDVEASREAGREEGRQREKAGEKISSKLGKIQRSKVIKGEVGKTGILPSGKRYRIVAPASALTDESEAKSPRRVSEEIKQARQGLRTPEAKVVQAEPVEAQVFSGKVAKIVEEGSFQDVMQQLLSDTGTRNLALRALSETGGQLKIDGIDATPEELGLTGKGNKFGGNPVTLKYWKRTNVKELYDFKVENHCQAMDFVVACRAEAYHLLSKKNQRQNRNQSNSKSLV